MCRLAAETLAGLNNLPGSAAKAHSKSRSGGKSLDQSSSDSLLEARKPIKLAVEKTHKAKKASACKPAAQRHPEHLSAAPQAMGSSASLHPILGFSVPHARRSYHNRDSMATAMGKGGDSGQVAAVDEQALPCETARPSPIKTKQHRAFSVSSGPPRAAAPLQRLPSDSSMTVSADSNA